MHQKTVLITGCSSGIGRATALGFLDEEWEVYATARNPADIETLGDRGANIATLDVTDQSDVDRVVDRILDEQGRIDCLVNNAGYGQMGPIEDVPTEMVHEQFDVNVYGPHRLTRAVLPHMRSQGEGTIVNVSSVVGRVSFPGGGVYAGSKFALEAMTDALRAEVEEYDIDAVLVEPGPVETQFANRVEAEVNGGDEHDGLERSGAYEKFYKLFDDTEALGGTGPGAIPPERVAEDIVNAASSTKPRARYQPGTVARIAVLGRFLPDAWRDTLFGFVRKLP
ncbi:MULTISPECIES: SDR family oxidoreductase [Haloferax]|uniref:SDR family NAD(P)-dependent oxidoreductase n=2 Tax=Haloferax TaxID=2251 RepID=A0A6G1YXW1_9EURY|nr:MULTISPECIES: SDR family oxidoreductase [Haloferax]KAB1186516.1 SDR family oxidoreductase [Haloferax sp. CBA1149]MRW79122.1 SDR family NAD(P)-dependent oxidoreductase [Haloferax marinisediminis]